MKFCRLETNHVKVGVGGTRLFDQAMNGALPDIEASLDRCLRPFNSSGLRKRYVPSATASVYQKSVLKQLPIELVALILGHLEVEDLLLVCHHVCSSIRTLCLHLCNEKCALADATLTRKFNKLLRLREDFIKCMVRPCLNFEEFVAFQVLFRASYFAGMVSSKDPELAALTSARDYSSPLTFHDFVFVANCYDEIATRRENALLLFYDPIENELTHLGVCCFGCFRCY